MTTPAEPVTPRAGKKVRGMKDNHLLQKSELGKSKKLVSGKIPVKEGTSFGFSTFQTSTAFRVKESFGVSPKVFMTNEGEDLSSVKDSVSEWREHKAAAAKLGGKNFLSMNKKTLQQGGTTPKSVSELRKTTESRFKLGKKEKKPLLPSDRDPHFTYGVPSGEKEDMESVMKMSYRYDWVVSSLQNEEKKRSRSATGSPKRSMSPKKATVK